MDLSVAKKRPSETDEEYPPVKNRNIDNQKQGTEKDSKNGSSVSVEEGLSGQDHLFKDLSGFKLKNVLSNSADVKRLTVEGTFADGQSAVVILEKKPFSEDHFKELFSSKSRLNKIFQNDIYGNYDCLPEESSAAIKATVVYPATDKHIEKYKFQDIVLVDETPEIYEKVVLPHLQGSQFNNQWVFNILEHKKETDRIIFEDPDPKTGFILLPDLKWDGIALENLYLSGIVHARDIKSLRDLTSEHLPLLKNILGKGVSAIKKKYGLSRSQLRIFLHYQPSYYHLHVHVTALKFNAPGIYTEKSHLLQTVISNIEGNPKYYQKAALPFVLRVNDPLYTKLTEFGYEF